MKPLQFVFKCLVPTVALICVMMPMTSTASSQATLEWDANDFTPDAYRLYWRAMDESYNYNRFFDADIETMVTMYGLVDDRKYNFVVRACEGVNTSANSNEVAFTTTDAVSPPDADPPTIPQATSPVDGAVNVPLRPVLRSSSFDDPDASDNHIQTSWQIYRANNNILALEVISENSLTELTVPAGFLKPNTEYYWTVEHINQNGASSPPALQSFFTTGEDVSDPSSNLSAGSGSGGGGGIASTGCLIQTLLD